MFYLYQTTATLLSPTKKGWKRKCVHSLSSETASESQQPQPQMFFPFPLKPTKHSLESFRSVFPIFFLVFATSNLTGRRAGRKNPLETLHLFLPQIPTGVFPTFHKSARLQLGGFPFILTFQGLDAREKQQWSSKCPITCLSLSAPIKINQPKFHPP